jgi:hypothetical protein
VNFRLLALAVLRILTGMRSPVATVLVTRGTLTPGTPLLAGTSPCSTRRLLTSSLQHMNSVGPGTPVLVTGWKSLPAAGDEVLASSEADIKRARANRERKRELESVMDGVEAINAARKADKEKEGKERASAKLRKGRHEQLEGEEGSVIPEEVEKRNLRVIVKGDVSGSVEALIGAIEGIGNHLAGVRIVSSGVGDVSDSDVMMAKAAQGTSASMLFPPYPQFNHDSHDNCVFRLRAPFRPGFRFTEPRSNLLLRYHLPCHGRRPRSCHFASAVYLSDNSHRRGNGVATIRHTHEREAH